MTLGYTSDRYVLTFPEDRPFVYVDTPEGHHLAELFIASSVHAVAGRDDTTRLGEWAIEEQGDETVFTLRAESSIWTRKTFRFRCAAGRFSYGMTVDGSGDLAEVYYFGGYCSARPRWGSGFFLSGHNFVRGFNPEPNTEDRWYFDPAGGSVVDMTGAPLPGKRHWLFTPAPFCLAFETEDGWLGMGVEAAPGKNRFTEYQYVGQDGFYLSLPYEGYTSVDGSYDLPSIGFDFARSVFGALEAHVQAVRESGAVHEGGRKKPGWWSRPMFCGWGAQCARAAAEAGYRPVGEVVLDGPAFLGTMRWAPDQARQDVYEDFLAALESHGISPSTITIDDKWQSTYGENIADPQKWPELHGFIERRHANGQHVLLWLKAWDREGVPDAECIRNRAGVSLAVDCTNPGYERRLRASIRRMLSPAGYDADGFKIDFTHRIPVGPSLQTYAGPWGLELMKRYLGIIYSEAKLVKPDALVVTHTPHPYLADVLDMVRLNDMLDLTGLDDPGSGRDIARTVSTRAQVARIACPGALIDTDNWPVRDKAMWREYIRLQPSFGVPSLYFATQTDLTQERFDDDDYALIRETWNGIDAGDRGEVA